MIKCRDWPISICTWSLGNDFDRIDILKEQTELSHIHLAVSPALGRGGGKYISRVQRDQWNVTATMIDFPQEDYSTLESIKVSGGIVPDGCWEENRKRVFDAIDITVELGVEYLSFHVGFIDMANLAELKKLYDRIEVLGDKAVEKNVKLLMETGQESASQLRQFLEELNRPALMINFDPANMVLYNKDEPKKAVEVLADWIKHVHIKDAVRAQRSGKWGEEVAWGSGEVGGVAFLKALEQINYRGVLAIEREAGTDRFGDIVTAIEMLHRYCG